MRPVTGGRGRPVDLAVMMRDTFLALHSLVLARLADRAQMTKQAMAELVRHLEGHGYLERVPDPADGRAKLVLPTERGREVIGIAQDLVAALRADLEKIRRTSGG